MYQGKTDLRVHGSIAEICGWGIKTEEKFIPFKRTKYLEPLHCILVRLYGEKVCQKAIHRGNYMEKLLCGQRIGTSGLTTSVITLFALQYNISKMCCFDSS